MLKINKIKEVGLLVLSSRWLFVGTLAVFSLHTIVLAITLPFPMIFDERYHFTLINFYAHHLSPIISTQPPELAVLGDATRMTSFLSHYILSFPLRLVQSFTSDVTTQVVFLRTINVAFVVLAITLFRHFIIRLTKSRALASASVILYCLIPVTSLLASQINYDNVMMACFAGLLVVSVNIIDDIQQRSAVALRSILLFTVIVTAGSLVKFVFVPIATVATVLLIAYVITRRKRITVIFSEINRVALGTMALLCLITISLCAERFGGNLISYGSMLPDCSSVQTVDTCKQYGPWARNYDLEQAASSDSSFTPNSFPGFIAHIWYPIMATGIGVTSDHNGTTYTPPLMRFVGELALAGIVLGGFVSLIIYRKKPIVLLLVASAGLYMLMMVHYNYGEFVAYHKPVAIQGRYVLLLFIPLFAISIRAYLDAARYTTTKGRELTLAYGELPVFSIASFYYYAKDRLSAITLQPK